MRPGSDARTLSAHAVGRRRILVCVTGLSPQIVTETLFALCVARSPRWIPHEVCLITTQRGAENARLMLLSAQPGWLHRLRKDWQLPPIAFDESSIRVIRDADGAPLQDILDDADNQRAGDCIAELVRQLADDVDTEIHASIAGGRKTMGFFMGYAMSLWGRAQDRLSHVLVSSPFESRAEFYYPTPGSQVIAGRFPGDDPLDASTAKVWLGDIPFVRLRALLPDAIKSSRSGFAQAVAAANRALDEISLEIDVAQSCVRVNQHSIHLPPMQLSLLCLLAWRCQQQRPALHAPLKDVDDPEWKCEVRRDLQLAIGEMHIPGSFDQRLNDQLAMGNSFAEQLSKLERTLRDSGALPLRELISHEATNAHNRQRGYALRLRPDQVRIIAPARPGKLAKTTLRR